MKKKGNRLAYFWMGFGAFWLFLFIMSESPFDPPTDLPMLGFLFLIPFAGGLISVLKKKRAEAIELLKQREEEAQSLQIALLSMARDGKGRLSMTEVSLTLRIPVQKAEVALDLCVRQRVAEVKVTEGGQIVYWFREFLPGPEDEILF